jgi:hypothetical protein
VFWAGYNIGQIVLSWHLRDVIRKEAISQGINVDSEFNIKPKNDKPKVSKLWIEKVHDIMYLYDKDTDDFVCQANTLEELATLALKYKNIKYASVMNGDDVFAFVDGSVKSAKEILE